MLDPRKIATLGIGFGALAVASLGFVAPETVPEVVVPAVQAHQPSAGGGSGSDAGQGYVYYKDHGWVKLTKAVRYGIKANPLQTLQSAQAVGTTRSLKRQQGQLIPTGISSHNFAGDTHTVHRSVAATYTQADATVKPMLYSISKSNGSIETIGIDEILALMEFIQESA